MRRIEELVGKIRQRDYSCRCDLEPDEQNVIKGCNEAIELALRSLELDGADAQKVIDIVGSLPSSMRDGTNMLLEDTTKRQHLRR